MAHQQSVKIKSSLVIFGHYECQCRPSALKPDFLTLNIRLKNENILLQLSFKHIHRIELLDNSEDKGAGLVVHVNDYMASRIQDSLDKNGRGFYRMRTPYASNSFIVMDLINSDPQSIDSIKQMLTLCDHFHRDYVIEQCHKNNVSVNDTLPAQYVSIIGFNQWKTILANFKKDVMFEHIETLTDTQKPMKFTIGKIINYHQDVFTMQRDGSVVQHRRVADETSGVGMRKIPGSTSVLLPDANNGRADVSVVLHGRQNKYSDTYHHVNSPHMHDGRQNASMQDRSINRMALSGSHITPCSPFKTSQPIRLLLSRPSSQQQQQQNYSNQQRPYQPVYFPQQQQLEQDGLNNSNSSSVSMAMDYETDSHNLSNISLPSQHLLIQSPSTYAALMGNSPSSSAIGMNNDNTGTPTMTILQRRGNGNTTNITRRATTANANAQKREIHVIEDEEEEPADDASTSKKRNDTIFVYPSSGTHGCSVHYADLKYLDHSYMLNDTIIDFYLKYIYHELVDEQRRKKIFMFNSFFYSRLSQPPPNCRTYASANNRWKRVQSNFQSVKSWTKKVNLFDMDYVIVPINEDIHWYLAIIVNPRDGIVYNESANGNTDSASTSAQVKSEVNGCASHLNLNDGNNLNSAKGPFVVVFDSLIDSDRKHSLVLDFLAEYLTLEYADKKSVMGLPGTSFSKTSMKLITPTGTPQQKNYVDCGVFLLKFAEIFMTQPPKILSKQVAFRSWYPLFKIKGKRDEIKAIIRGMASQIKYADFLPPNPTPTSKKNAKGKKLSLAAPIDILMPSIRTRRHSETSVWEQGLEQHFTSLGMNSLSRSLDSILEELKEMPPVVITFRDPIAATVTKKKSFSATIAAKAITTTTTDLFGTITTTSTTAPAATYVVEMTPTNAVGAMVMATPTVETRQRSPNADALAN